MTKLIKLWETEKIEFDCHSVLNYKTLLHQNTNLTNIAVSYISETYLNGYMIIKSFYNVIFSDPTN